MTKSSELKGAHEHPGEEGLEVENKIDTRSPEVSKFFINQDIKEIKNRSRLLTYLPKIDSIRTRIHMALEYKKISADDAENMNKQLDVIEKEIADPRSIEEHIDHLEANTQHPELKDCVAVHSLHQDFFPIEDIERLLERYERFSPEDAKKLRSKFEKAHKELIIKGHTIALGRTDLKDLLT